MGLKTRVKEKIVLPDQPFIVDAFQPGDAKGMVNLFLTVYGKDYPIKTFYYRDKIIRENSLGNIYSVVARTPSGDIVGHGALFRSSPWSQNLFEIGQMLILPSYRTTFAAFKIHQYLSEDLILKILPDGIFGEAVCNHITTQKVSSLIDMKDVAIELDLMPVSAYVKEKSAPGRVSCLIQFKGIKNDAQEIFIPRMYREQADFILQDLHLKRKISESSTSMPLNSKSNIHRKFFSHAGVGRFNVVSTGRDFGRKLAELERLGSRKGMQVMQFFINLAEPWSGEAIEILTNKGYFLGGLAPQWFVTDGLLLQKIHTPPDVQFIKLHTPKARSLLEMILTDKKRADQKIYR